MLGIDPGLRLTGYAVLESHPGRAGAVPSVVEAGVFRFDDSLSVARRLVELQRDLSELLERSAPTHAAVEALYSHVAHPMTGVVMAHARGVVLLTLQARALPILELPPTEVKKAVTGNGHAPKAQVQSAVASVLGLALAPAPPDIADAMAIALCALSRTPPA